MKVLARYAGAATGAVICCIAPRHAHAWVDTHLVSDDIRVEIDPPGTTATISHTVRLKVQGGPLRWLDVPGVDRDATPLPGATVTSEREGTAGVPLTATIRPDGSMRLAVEGTQGIRRGLFSFQFGYRTSSVERRRIDGERSVLRLFWTGPTWPSGLDNARCTFVLPPGVADASTGTSLEGTLLSESSSFLTTIRRGTDHDEIDLVRPHVARTEAVSWTVEVHPRAFADEKKESRTSTGSTEDAPTVPEHLVRSSATWLYSLIFVGFSCLVGVKAHAVSRMGTRSTAVPRPLITLGSTLRALLSGGVLASGIALQRFAGDPIWGTLLVLLAMVLSTYRPAAFCPQPKGEGRWLPLRDTDAFSGSSTDPGHCLDVSTRLGKIVFALTGLAVLGVFLYLVPRVTYDAYLLLFDSLALLPVWFTGTRRDLPPDPFRSPAPRLARLARRLRSHGLRTTAWARSPKGGPSFDELRLLVTPRLPQPGFSGIEIGYTICKGVGKPVLLPELLVRVVEGTTGHDALSRVLRGFRWVRGRKPDERVAIVRPRLPTLACTAELARRLADGARQPEQLVPNAPARVSA